MYTKIHSYFTRERLHVMTFFLWSCTLIIDKWNKYIFNLEYSGSLGIATNATGTPKKMSCLYIQAVITKSQIPNWLSMFPSTDMS